RSRSGSSRPAIAEQFRHQPPRLAPAIIGGPAMTPSSLATCVLGSLVAAAALTPARAADMTHERALNAAQEPQNWILHHGNYAGHRFSALKQITTENVKDLKLMFTVALASFEAGGRAKFATLEATPIVEDGMMYVPDGWGRVYAIDVSSGKKGV